MSFNPVNSWARNLHKQEEELRPTKPVQGNERPF